MNKNCNKCSVNKALEEFPWKDKNKNTRKGICKSCVLIYQAKHYKNSSDRRDKIKEANKNFVDKLRNYVINYLQNNPCVDCGEKDVVVLDFDHKESSNKLLAISAIIIRGWSLETLIKEIAKCDVRCANCHRRKTAKQFGYWKYLNSHVRVLSR